MNEIVKNIYLWMLSPKLFMATQEYRTNEANSHLDSLKIIKLMEVETENLKALINGRKNKKYI